MTPEQAEQLLCKYFKGETSREEESLLLDAALKDINFIKVRLTNNIVCIDGQVHYL